MDDEKICDLEVTAILKKQYKYDLIKNFLIKLINTKQQDSNYSNLQLLTDVSFYYQEIENIIDISNNTLEKTINILEINYWDNSEINKFLNLSWKQIKEETIKNIIDIEKINNLPNNYLVNSGYQQQNFLK